MYEIHLYITTINYDEYIYIYIINTGKNAKRCTSFFLFFDPRETDISPPREQKKKKTRSRERRFSADIKKTCFFFFLPLYTLFYVH